jgi:hypothetical protein
MMRNIFLMITVFFYIILGEVFAFSDNAIFWTKKQIELMEFLDKNLQKTNYKTEECEYFYGNKFICYITLNTESIENNESKIFWSKKQIELMEIIEDKFKNFHYKLESCSHMSNERFSCYFLISKKEILKGE